jgi:4-hydroxythreonine-4-phosphate dehydrogenase
MVERIKRKCGNREKIIAVTMGDPGGVGPELALSLFKRNSGIPLLLIGDYSIFERARMLLKLEKQLRFLTDISNFDNSFINVIDVGIRENYSFQKTSSVNGKAAFLSIKKAISLAVEKKVCAVVTCPISKYGLKMAGFDYPGHTEIFAKLTGTEKYRMLFVSEHFKVLLHTIHVPLEKVPEEFLSVNLEDTFRIAYEFLSKYFNVEKPVVYVAGLNPHAGENGKMGREEEEIIKPVMRKISNELEFELAGPFPADTLFVKALKDKPDMIIAMYHDQGLIPVKLIDFYNAVNITAGIPFIRTSPDHGTAFDIAWLGKADNQSLLNAVKLAYKLS